MGGASSAPAPEGASDAPPSEVASTSAPAPDPPPPTPSSAGARWGWGEVFGALVEQEVITVSKVDSMQAMWQRALAAKTRALERLQDEIADRDRRIHALELERAVFAEAQAFARGEADAAEASDADVSGRRGGPSTTRSTVGGDEASPEGSDDERDLAAPPPLGALTAAERAAAAAARSTEAVLRDMRRETEERETRLVALTAALQRSSARSSEHERAVASAQEELATRAAYFEAAEAFLRAKLERSCEETLVLREELGAGERAMRSLQTQFTLALATMRESQARLAAEAEAYRARLRAALDDQRGTTEETERELRDVTDQSAALETLRKIADGLDAETEAARKPKNTDDPEGDGDAIADAADAADEKARAKPRGLVEAVTAALAAAAAERAALASENETLRERVEEMNMNARSRIAPGARGEDGEEEEEEEEEEDVTSAEAPPRAVVFSPPGHLRPGSVGGGVDTTSASEGAAEESFVSLPRRVDSHDGSPSTTPAAADSEGARGAAADRGDRDDDASPSSVLSEAAAAAAGGRGAEAAAATRGGGGDAKAREAKARGAVSEAPPRSPESPEMVEMRRQLEGLRAAFEREA